MPPFVGVAVNVTLVPEQMVPAGEAALVTEGVSDGVRESEPKLVVPVVMPVIPAAADAVMFPAAAPLDVA